MSGKKKMINKKRRNIRRIKIEQNKVLSLKIPIINRYLKQ